MKLKSKEIESFEKQYGNITAKGSGNGEKHTMKFSELLRRFLPYFKNYKGMLIFDLFCAVMTCACEIVSPLIVKEITGRVTDVAKSLGVGQSFAQAMPDWAGWLARLGIWYVLLRLIDAAANYYMQSGGHIMGSRIETDMRRDLFHHLQQLSFSYYNNTKIGQLMARITSDLFDVTEFAHHGPEELLIAVVKIVASFIILCGMNVWLTLLVFIFIPFMVLGTRYFSKHLRGAMSACRHQVGEINAQVEDSLLGIRVVKSFANEELEEEKFRRGNLAFLFLKKKQYRYMAGFNTSTRVFDGLMNIVVTVAGAIFLIKGLIGIGDYVAYLLYVGTLLNSIRRIVEFTEQFQRGMTGIERFCQVMDAKIEIADSKNAAELTDVKGVVEFRNVSFHYGDDEKHEVISSLSAKVEKGRNIAVVGPSGSGKTTLCSLIPRFFDVTEGQILIDGRDIRELTLKSLRGGIGTVQQDVYLFSGSVYDNIVYGRPGASREDVIEAAKLAGAHDFISALPDGYDTYIGERGVRLSGGQKQRLSIARVFLKNPPILILDEATSALDNESELLVQKSLERLAKGRTTFTIAHRLTTIRNADEIWVLTEKGIEEKGSHAELMARNGLYHELYSMYTEKM